jgi:hypothetical protein
MRLAQPLRRLDPLVGVSRRHADVRDDHVRFLGIHRGKQGVQVAARRRDLDVMLRLEQPSNALADDQVILGEDDPDRHARRIRRCPSS